MDDSNDAALDPLATADGEGQDNNTPPAPVPPQLSPLEQSAMRAYQQNKAALTPPTKPTPPPKAPPRPAGFGQKLSALWNSVTGFDDRAVEAEHKLGRAVGRGTVDFVNSTANSIVGVGGAILDKTGLGHAIDGKDFDDWYHAGDMADINPLQVSEQKKDDLFGKNQGGVYSFVENATAFTEALETGKALTGVAQLAPGAIKTLAQTGLVGLAQATMTDPRAKRLSDLLEDAAPSLSNPLTRWLKTDGKDSEALARLKSGLEGSMTGYAIDKFIGSVASVIKSVVNNGATKAATPELDAAIQAAKDAKPDVVTAVPLEGGGATLVHNPEAAVQEYGSGNPGRYVGYRGSDPAMPGGNTEKLGGTFIAQKQEYAQNFVDTDGGPRIMHKAEVDVQKPFILQAGDNAERLAQAEATAQGTPEKAAELAESYRKNGMSYVTPEAKAWLKENGYDAVQSSEDGANPAVAGRGGHVMIALDDSKVTLTPHAEGETVSPSPIPSGMVFDSMADAESHAAAINEAQRAQSIPMGHINDQDVSALMEAVKNAKPGDTMADIVPKGVFNYNYFGGTEATQAIVESLATQLQHAFPGLRNVVAGAGDTGAELTVKAIRMAQKDDAASWISSTKSDADVIHAQPALQMARKIIIKQMAGKMAELAKALDVNPANIIAHNNMKALGDQMLHLFGETASIDSGAGRLLQSIKNLIPDDVPEAVGSAASKAGKAAEAGRPAVTPEMQGEAASAAKELKEARAAVEAKLASSRNAGARGGVDTPLQHPIDDPESVRLQNARLRAQAIIDKANGGKFEYPPLEQGPETMGKLHQEGINYNQTLDDAAAQASDPLVATEAEKAAARANARPQKPVLAQAAWLDASEKELDRLAAGQLGEAASNKPSDPLVTPVDKAVTMGKVARGNVRDAQLRGAGNANEDIVNDIRNARQERADNAAASSESRREAQRQEWEDAKANGRVPRGTMGALLTKDDWQQLARQIRLSEGDPALILDSMVGKVSQRAAGADPRKMDLFNAFRVNMMMSGPKTSIVLAASQAIAAVQAPMEYWMGGMLTRNTALREQGADMLAGLWTNASAAWKTAAKAFNLGHSLLTERGVVADTGQDTTNGGAWGFLGKLMQVPSRVVMGVDEFYKNLNYLNAVRGLSLRASAEDLARMPNMPVEEQAAYRAQKLAEDLHTSTDINGRALNPAALSYSKDATFSTPLSGFGKTVGDARIKHPALKVILPFWNTPYNLAKYAWQRTPILGALAGQMREDIAAGGERQAVALGKQAAGAAVWSSAAMLAVSGNMTGAGPTEPQLRRQWGPEGAGNQPYSIRIPGTDKWISYRRIDQLGTPLSMVADIVEMSGHLRETDTQNAYAKFAAALSADLLSKTFLGSMANFFDAAHSGDPDKVQLLAENLAGSVIPAALRQSDTDGAYREVRGMIDALKSRVPGFSSTLEPKRNILGEVAMKPPGTFHQQWNPFTLTPGGRVDKVQDDLVQLGKSMSMPDDHINGLDLTDRGVWKNSDPKHANQSPYDRMLELMAHPKDGGDSLRQQLTELINSDDWTHATDSLTDPTGVRRIMVSRIIQGAQKEAMGSMVEEYPGLEDAIEEAKGLRKAALEAPIGNAPTPWTGTGNRISTKAPELFPNR